MKPVITFLLTSLFLAGTAFAASKRIDVSKDLDNLGGDEALIRMAQNIDGDNRARIVQKRAVDRYTRFEFGINYGGQAGGDSYLKTTNIGAQLDFHFTPRWSLGFRYYDYGNDLTPEGKRVFDDARAAYDAKSAGGFVFPDIDPANRAVMAVLNWYPIYGKTSLFETRVTQFDMYFLAGGGQIELSSGKAPVYTGGVGVGWWITNHFTMRGEIRYQSHQDKIITGSRNINTVVGTVGIGLMI